MPSKNPQSKKCRFQEKGRQGFKGERDTKNISHEAGVFRPVHAELKFQSDASYDAHGKVNDKQAAPEFCQLQVNFPACPYI